ncbi:unnamed protein product [Fraxinus pennsylvanica]|uniref:Uncharacterized protein n=1 Tax=Fraxinus pennsylvanica TaxID=56036 RepID=A0AAD1Z520_9LAMI|nr:unnamed protein product [Fraxinus pennsylvanica]
MGKNETSSSWKARHQVSGLMRITKLTLQSWLLPQEGDALHSCRDRIMNLKIPSYSRCSLSFYLESRSGKELFGHWCEQNRKRQLLGPSKEQDANVLGSFV